MTSETFKSGVSKRWKQILIHPIFGIKASCNNPGSCTESPSATTDIHAEKALAVTWWVWVDVDLMAYL
jgi:hypothetical protein